MKQLTTLSLLLLFLMSFQSTALFSKENSNEILEKSEVTSGTLFLVLDPANPSCGACFDGGVTTSVAGGISPYFYQWSNGATTANIDSLPNGTYTVTVTDSFGCSAVESTELNGMASSQFTLQVFTLGTTCFGENNGNAVAVADGGMMPYTYLWSTGDTLNTTSNLVAGIYTVTVSESGGEMLIDTFEIIQPDSLTVTAFANQSCNGANGGSAEVEVDGGVFPYSFLWSTGDTTDVAEGLSTGTYGVTITDGNGCVASSVVELEQPIELNINPEPTSPSCYFAGDGFINASTWGGTQPYTYLWSDGQTSQIAINIDPGIYTVTVTDAVGCTIVDEAFLDGGNPIDLAVQGISTVSCFGGSDGAIQVDAFGGNPGTGAGYSFIWDNGDTGTFVDSLEAGTHYVTITDANNCSHIDSVNVSQPVLLTSFTFSSPVCVGASDGTATVVPSGGTLPYTYLWSNGGTTQTIDGLVLGTYYVTLTDINGCFVMDSIDVTLNTNAFDGMTTSTDVSCANGNDGTATVQAMGGVAPYTYLWSNGSTDSLVIGLVAGTYSVTVFDAFNCTLIQTATVSVPSPIAVNETVVNVGCNGMTGSISIDPSGGVSPYTVEWFDGSTNFVIDGLAAGTYAVNVTDANQCVQQFMIEIIGTNDAPPVVMTQDISVTLNANNVATITAMEIDNGTTDDCGLASITIDISEFDCSNIGANTVTLTATDNSGNASMGTAIVTVVDEILPEVLTQNITLALDASGTVMVNPMQVNNLSSDNCGIENMSLDVAEFNCSHLGENMVTLTVTDASGNSQSGTAIVTIVDIENPVVTTNPITIYLDAQGIATLTANDIANNVSDNCGVDSLEIGLANFDCSNTGMNLVTLTAIDASGNMATANTLVTVVDSILPIITCPMDIEIMSCDAVISVTYDLPAIDDNCPDQVPTLVNGIESGGMFPVGTTTNTYNLTTTNGEVVSCSFDVTVMSQSDAEIIVDTIVNPTPGSMDGSIEITVVGTGPFTYEWFNNGNLVSTEEDPSGLAHGIYEVFVTDPNGCVTTLIIDFSTAINEPEIVKNIKIFPNPVSSLLYVDIDLPILDDVQVQLINTDGKIILEDNFKNRVSLFNLNVSNLANGIYILKLVVNEEIVTKRVMVSR